MKHLKTRYLILLIFFFISSAKKVRSTQSSTVLSESKTAHLGTFLNVLTFSQMFRTKGNAQVLKLNISVASPPPAGARSKDSSNYWRKHRREECQQECEGSENSNVQLSGFMDFFHEEVRIAPSADLRVTDELSPSTKAPQGLWLSHL